MERFKIAFSKTVFSFVVVDYNSDGFHFRRIENYVDNEIIKTYT